MLNIFKRKNTYVFYLLHNIVSIDEVYVIHNFNSSMRKTFEYYLFRVELIQ